MLRKIGESVRKIWELSGHFKIEILSQPLNCFIDFPNIFVTFRANKIKINKQMKLKKRKKMIMR